MPRTMGTTRFSQSSPFGSVTVLVPSLTTMRLAVRRPLRHSLSRSLEIPVNLPTSLGTIRLRQVPV